jgi:hypothetical protein
MPTINLLLLDLLDPVQIGTCRTPAEHLPNG